MRGEHRWELQRALPQEVGVGAALRDAGLRAIGRADLVIEAPREEGGNRAPRESTAEHVTVSVHLTGEQLEALTSAAKTAGQSRSTLLHDALRAELRLKGVKPADHPGGWTRGKRRSKSPPR